MSRGIAAIVLTLTLTPAVLHAQDATLTVTAASADVHKGPSTVTPVIGHVPRGAALQVSRNLGSWVRVPWPAGPDGFGYVHVTMGRVGEGTPQPSAMPTRPAATSAPAQREEPAPMPPARASSESRIGVQSAQGTTTISHVVGVGGLVQSARGFGATGRVWRGDHFGFEFRLTRHSMTSATADGRVTSLDFEPRVVYALFDHVSDYFWIRPYVGSGLTFSHQTLSGSVATATSDTSFDNGMGWRLFGGGELTFAGATRFGLSTEVGYRSSPTPFPGFEADRVTLSIAGHWYVK